MDWYTNIASWASAHPGASQSQFIFQLTSYYPGLPAATAGRVYDLWQQWLTQNGSPPSSSVVQGWISGATPATSTPAATGSLQPNFSSLMSHPVALVAAAAVVGFVLLRR